MDDDPFAALVAEMTSATPNADAAETSAPATIESDKTKDDGVQQPQPPLRSEEKKVNVALPAKDEVRTPASPPPQQQQVREQKVQQEQQEAAEEEEKEDEADNGFLEMVNSVQDLDQLRHKFIAFRKDKDAEMYELKNKFTEISRRQKEVFIEVETRRKTAVNKGKKYKQTAQKLYYQIQKMNNDLKFERQKKEELSAEVAVVRNQKKEREKAIEQLTNSISSLKSNLNETEQSKDQIMDEFKQTHSVIDKLIQNEKMQARLKCAIEITPLHQNGDEAKDAEHGNFNLCIAKLRFLDSSLDASTVSMQWNRSHFTQLLPIKNATRTQYMLSADDVGSIIKVEVRSKNDPDCFETAVLKNGAVRMHALCNKLIQENLLKINKQQIEFQVEPDLEEQNTAKLLASHLKDSSSKEHVKSLILLFNRDKIKLRIAKKNHTIDKEEYNEGMRMTLSAMNHNRFSLKLSSTKKYVLLSKTPFERDNIAILLRCYMERLKRSSHNFLCEFYLRLANEKTNGDLLHKQGAGTGGQLTRDQLVSKILAPISSNPRILDSFTTKLGNATSLTLNSTVLMSAPISVNRADDEPADYNVDELFPYFNDNAAAASTSANSSPPPPQQGHEQQPLPPQRSSVVSSAVIPPKKVSPPPVTAEPAEAAQATDNDAPSEEVTFTAEELEDAGMNSEDTKKAWKALQFEEKAQIASEAELQNNALMPAPASKLTKKSGKKKKKKKSIAAENPQEAPATTTAATEAVATETAQPVPAPAEANSSQAKPAVAMVALSALFSDRIDCLLNASGQIVKHQVVGTLALSYNESVEIAEDRFFYGKLTNMEHVKTKILNPLTTESVDENGLIRVKMQNEKNIAVLKYVWDSQNVEQSLPFSVAMTAEHEDDNIFNVSCTIKPNEHHQAAQNGKLKELSITGSLKDDVEQCVDHTTADNVDFIWNQDIPKKFIWSITGDATGASYVLNAKFKSATSDNKVQLKIQFDIENDAISTIDVESVENPQNAANIVHTLRCMKSGDFIVR